jgi:hypothetical protein
MITDGARPGKHTKLAIEHGHLNSEFTHSYVSLPEDTDYWEYTRDYIL